MIEIINKHEEDIRIIQVLGEVDASSSIQLDNEINAFLESGEKKILIDCEGLNYISSAGLGVFMSYIQEFENQGVKIAIFGLSEKVRNVFQILGLDQLMRIEKTKEQAKLFINEL